MIVEKKGMIVYNASNGKVTIEMSEASEESFHDEVLMNVRMPVMVGIAAARAIQKYMKSFKIYFPQGISE